MLIDGDNARPKLIERIIRETEKYGSITIRRIYGDWTKENMKGWMQHLHGLAIQPIQQFRYTIGKNATDSAMIIDAMDILHQDVVSGFCIVSSDSDYTRLSTRIRENGLFVIGVGEKKTPEAFVKACNVFVYTENLDPETAKMKTPSKGKARTPARKREEPDPTPLLVEAFEMTVKEDWWVSLSEIGTALNKIDPGFDPRTYGYRTLSQIFKAYPKKFEIKYEDETGPSVVWVRMVP